MSSQYSGSLLIKKKAELQEIANALGIPDAGTREDLQQRIKRHLDDYSADLEGDPVFSGLYARKRQRSLQPPGVIQPSRFRSSEPRFSAIPEERGFSPVMDDLRDVSVMLPHAPMSPAPPSPSPLRRASMSPSSLPPLPPSPAKSIIADIMAQPEVQAVVEMERDAMGSFTQVLSASRTFLSNGRNIFVMSALLDFLSIMFAIHGNSYYPVPPITAQVEPALQATVWVTVHWAIPSVILPVIIGYLISFPAPILRPGFDVLSGSIVRVAANVAYPFPSMIFMARKDEVQSLDVLGVKWRVISAGVTLAFAFAEAINRAPTRELIRPGSP